MKKKYWAFLIGSWCLSVGMQAAKVDTLSVHSDAMNKEVQVITICPDKAMAGEKCPVLYLLHGYGGNAGTWLGIKPELPQIADKDMFGHNGISFPLFCLSYRKLCGGTRGRFCAFGHIL